MLTTGSYEFTKMVSDANGGAHKIYNAITHMLYESKNYMY